MSIEADGKPLPFTDRMVLPLFLRLALRELRTGLSGFYVFVTCIALGVAAIAGVGSLADTLQEGLEAQGQRILGGDIAVRLVHRRASEPEREYLEKLGRLSEVGGLRAMAQPTALADKFPPAPTDQEGPQDPDQALLIDVTAIDAGYPLYGEARFAGVGGLTAPISVVQETGTAAVDETLLARFGLEIGDEIRVGHSDLRVVATVEELPDKLSGRPALGPAVVMSSKTLEATGLIQPGSLIRWSYRLALDGADGATKAQLTGIQDGIRERFAESGFSFRDRTEPAPNVTRQIERFSQFLTLVGITTLMIGGVGVANAIAAYLDRKRGVIAAFKCLGASSRTIFATYLTQVMILALVGTLIGLAFGALMPVGILWLYRDALPIEVALRPQPGALALASLYGMVTALLFVLWPLGNARNLRPALLLRQTVSGERSRPGAFFIAVSVLSALLLAGVAIASAYAKMLALFACLALIGCFAVFLGVGYAIQWVARRMPRPRIPELALARAGLASPGGLARPVALSLGTGLTLLTAVSLVNGSLLNQFETVLPDKAPGYFVLDVGRNDVDAFSKLVKANDPGVTIDSAPILRGRIVKLKGESVDKMKPGQGAKWVLSGDRGLSFSAEIPAGSELVEGEWWPADYAGPPLVSFASDIAKGLGISVGDTVTVNVLGRNIQARIANLRTVDWESLGINFVLLFSPNTLSGAPYKVLMTLGLPDDMTVAQESKMLREIARDFPSFTAIRVRDAIASFMGIITQVMVGVQAAGALTLVIGAIVLAGALATAHRRRIRDAVIFKTLGATRRCIVTAHLVEYALLALLTGVIALGLGSLAAYLIVSRVMEMQFTFSGLAAAQAIGLAVAFVLAFGAIATARVLAVKVAPQLRAA
jgi:putative ABC transport system permease protein